MPNPLLHLINLIVIVCCGVALGYIIGHARGKYKVRRTMLEDHFPLLKTHEITN